MDEQSVFLQAIELEDDSARSVFLDNACAGDDTMRGRVEQLLEVHQRLDTFMDEPAEATFADLTDVEKVGTKIGAYTLREQIGEGGMGVVFVAEQKKPVRRKVAVKIIKPGMDSKQVVARFEAERQALALMDHPNIARVIDAGTAETGRPYFVMELVRGTPITQFCDQQQLEIDQRLRLFITICRAVQHAHQKGIIHRDIKPTNVLATLHDGVPVPKVIDFGVAKAINQRLTERTVYTRFSEMIGTPSYMSPEQAEMSGLDIDTRSDVYSLGVLLYELLTGHTPFDRETLKQACFDEMRRMIREDEPSSPSRRLTTLEAQAISTISAQRNSDPRKLCASLRGDLDWIVMQALEKDRNRRYESASAFSADVERYLKDEPVQACPPSSAYRLRKLFQRRKVTVVTTLVVALSLVVGAGISVWQARRAIISEHLADQRLAESQQNFQQALDAVDQMLARVGGVQLNDAPQMQIIRVELLEDALEFYRTLLQRDDGNPAVRFRMASAQVALGQALSRVSRLNEAESAFRDAITTLDDLVKQFPDESQYWSELGNAYNSLGWFLTGVSRAKKREDAHRNAAVIYEVLHAKHADDKGYLIHLAQSYRSVAEALKHQGLLTEASETVRKAIDFLRAAKSDRDGNEAAEYAEASEAAAYAALAAIHIAQGQYEQADPAFDNAIRLQRNSTQDALPYANAQHHLAIYLYEHGKLLQQLGRNEEAEHCYREAAAIWRHLVEAYPNVFRWAEHLDKADRFLVDLLVNSGRTEQAVREIRDTRPATAREFRLRAVRYAQLREFTLAEADYKKSLELAPDDAESWHSLGTTYDLLGYLDEAEECFRKAYEIAPKQGKSLAAIGSIQQKRGDLDAALATCEKVIAANSNSYSPWQLRGEIYTAMQRYDEAIGDFTKAVSINPDATHILKRRALAYFRIGQHDRALQDLSTRLEHRTSDDGTLTWIAPSLVAKCPDDSFRKGLLRLADEAVERSDESYIYVTRGLMHVSFGNLDQARSDFDHALSLDAVSSYSYYRAALGYLQMDDQAAYVNTCRAMLERFATTDTPNDEWWISWTCALAPDAVEDYSAAIQLAKQVTELKPQNPLRDQLWGALLFRAGKDRDAIERLSNAADSQKTSRSSPAYSWYFLAMTYGRLGNRAEANVFLSRANQQSDRELNDVANPASWQRTCTLKLLRAEAEAVLGAAEPETNSNNNQSPHSAPTGN